ncbi:13472_t:CDS:2, partial [Racocetra persica]
NVWNFQWQFSSEKRSSKPLNPFGDSATVEISDSNDYVEDDEEVDLYTRQTANMPTYYDANLPLISDQIKDVSPTGQYGTFVSLIIMLIGIAFKETIEDYKRHLSDLKVNQRKCKYLNLEHEVYIVKEWNQINVGDIIRVEDGEFFPADLTLLSSSEPESLCYIDTSNLDGETNLKIKQAVNETSRLRSPIETSRFTGYIKSEQPNDSLYIYEGLLITNTHNGEKKIPLDQTQLLIRGTRLKSISWIYGIVIFTGHETKLMKNTTATPTKRTNMEKMVNLQIIYLIGILLTLSLVCAMGSDVMA